MFPVYDNSLTLNESKQTGNIFFRKTLNGTLTFDRDGFELINTQPFEQRFDLLIKRNGSDYWNGYFYKTDCIFDFDIKTIQVTPSPVDQYTKIIDALDREFDLRKLNLAPKKFTYHSIPILQVYIASHQYLINIQNNTVWFTEVITPLYGFGDITAYWFERSVNQYYLAYQDNDGTGTAEGFYDATTRFRVDSAYEIRYNGTTWEIISTSTSEILTSTITDSTNPLGTYYGSSTPVPFELHNWQIYTRLLTDRSIVDGTGCVLFPLVDITPILKKRRYILPFTLGSNFEVNKTLYNIAPNLTHTLRIDNGDLKDISIWFEYDSIVSQLMIDGATDVNQNGYELHHVIDAILQQIDHVLSFSNSNAYSQFLYGITNPVTGEANLQKVICPKLNIINNTLIETAPQDVELLKLSEVFNLLKNGLNLSWFIESNHLKIEHLSYFENGKSYLSPIIGIDSTVLTEPKTGLNWSFGQNKFSYLKSKLPSQIRFKFGEQTTELFSINTVDVESVFTEKGRIEDRQISKFVTDLDHVLNQENGQKKGFFLLELDGTNSVAYQAINGKEIQNGALSLYHLVDKFHRHGLPGANVKINGISVVATSIIRAKKQDLVFGYSLANFNPMQLIQTNIGIGQVQSKSTNLTAHQTNIVVHHETN